MATGSKRSSADSDLLLCHVGLWRTSRFRFGCASVCEHSEIKFALHNTHVTPHPPLSRSPFCPCLGDADRVRLRESVNSPQEKAFYPLFLLHMQAQKKKLSKRKRRWGLTHMRSMCVGVAETGRFRALRSATTAVGGRHRLLKKAGENFN